MSASSSVPMQGNDRARATSTLVSAFTDDPVERWLYPDTQAYLEYFPQFVTAFGGRAFDSETAWRLTGFDAVALWLPPGVEPDAEAVVSVLTDTVAADKHPDVFAVLEQMDAAHPTYPHWYLPWFGVRSELQGQGLGSTLMAQCLAVVDASGLPAYLETPNPRTVPFYERHGFVPTGQAHAGGCPPITFMTRSA